MKVLSYPYFFGYDVMDDDRRIVFGDIIATIVMPETCGELCIRQELKEMPYCGPGSFTAPGAVNGIDYRHI
jgi:hypothetical protein